MMTRDEAQENIEKLIAAIGVPHTSISDGTYFNFRDHTSVSESTFVRKFGAIVGTRKKQYKHFGSSIPSRERKKERA